MDLETYDRREKMLRLREELLAVEEDRMVGSRGYSVEEVASAMRFGRWPMMEKQNKYSVIKHGKRIKIVCWILGLAVLLFLLWKRPVTIPVREGAVEVILYYRGQEVRIEDENQIKFLEENLRQTGIIRKLLWPSSGEHFGIVFLYEDGTSENFNLSSANYLKGRICLGGWRSSEFGVIYSSDEPIYQPVYDWLNEIYGVEEPGRDS